MPSVYDDVCSALGITASENDARRREAVAVAIVEAAEAGERDPAELRARAMANINGGQ
jgi:hypothetical protein